MTTEQAQRLVLIVLVGAVIVALIGMLGMQVTYYCNPSSASWTSQSVCLYTETGKPPYCIARCTANGVEWTAHSAKAGGPSTEVECRWEDRPK